MRVSTVFFTLAALAGAACGGAAEPTPAPAPELPACATPSNHASADPSPDTLHAECQDLKLQLKRPSNDQPGAEHP